MLIKPFWSDPVQGNHHVLMPSASGVGRPAVLRKLVMERKEDYNYTGIDQGQGKKLVCLG